MTLGLAPAGAAKAGGSLAALDLQSSLLIVRGPQGSQDVQQVGASVVAREPEGLEGVAAEVLDHAVGCAGGAGADRLSLHGVGGDQVAILTEGFCGSTGPFMFRVNEPGGLQDRVAIAGAPAYRAGTWYTLRIVVSGTHATFSVSDGVTTGESVAQMSTLVMFDQLRLSVDRCGGGAHAAFWDEVRVGE